MKATHLLAWPLTTAGLLLASACTLEGDRPGATTGPPVPTGILPAPNRASALEYPVDGVDLGQGWHREGVRKAIATCIDFTAREDTGQEQSMKLSVVTDHSALMDALDVSAEAQFKAIGYSASGKARFAKDTDVRSSSVNVLAHASVMNGVEYVAPADSGRPRRVDLTQHYRDLARRDPGAFEQECGDGFVAAVYSGAELTAVLSIDELDAKTRTETEADVSGSIGGFSAAGKVKAAQDGTTRTRKVRVVFYQTGGLGNPMPTTQEDLVTAVGQLPALAAKDPYNYRIQVQSYRSLPGYPAGIPEDRDEFRKTAATSYGRLATLQRAVLEALQTPGNYVDAYEGRATSTLRNRMQALHDELAERMRSLRKFSEECTFYDYDPKTPATPCDEAGPLDVRNDYAYRLRLPVLKTEVADPAKVSLVQAAIVDRHVRSVSRRRCERDLDDPGCLLEREIEQLHRKLSG